jgi:hypothetical protein
MFRSIVFSTIIGLTCSSAFATRYYVSTAGGGDCSSWGQACTLSTALASATSGDEVWVKSGTYTGPVSLVNGVKMIGGFAGSETAASQSNPASNETILDGGDSDRAVLSESNASSTLLRGFTIQNGDDDGMEGGGGLSITDSSAMFVQCTFKDNVAAYFGGAVAIRGSSAPVFVNCTFKDNGTGSGGSVQPLGGGAVFIHDGSAGFTNCLFHDNKAGEGGAVLLVDGSAAFKDCTIAENEATIGFGGGLFDEQGVATVQNSIFWDNVAVRGGDQIYGASATVTYSDVEGGWTGTGNINDDPEFVNPGSDDFAIDGCSPCKDAGSNSLLPTDAGDLDWDANTTETLPKDLALGARKTGGVSPVVDMGAYEAGACVE